MSPDAVAPAPARTPAVRLRAFARSPRVALVAALLLALVLFQAVFGVRLLSANAAYWSNPHLDMGQMVAGELAGLREPWRLPILVTHTLTAPEPMSLVYTDSIPWLTALLKLLHLGPVLSLLGTFLLLAWLAQAGAMYLLLRACGVERRWTLFVGTALALLAPAFLGRQLAHIALSGHALQIAGLALAVHAARKGGSWRVLAGFLALGVLAVGVHAYHVPPISLMLVAALGADVLQRRPGAIRRALVGLPAYLIATAAAAWTVGYFVGHAVSGGMAALGVYEMNMVAPVFPEASTLAGRRWNGAWFVPTFDPTGQQAYEGFNYLGAGVLVLLLAAAAARLRRGAGVAPTREAGGHPPGWRRWAPFTGALVLLTLYAIGPKGWLGVWQVWTVPLPTAKWAEPLALFRAHGRFFWTVGYALLALAITAADRLRPAPLRRGLLGAALALQAADTSGLLGGLHARFERPEALRIPAALAGPAFEGRDYRIYPGYFCTDSWLNGMVIRQLSLAAQRRHASTTSAETARAPAGACQAGPPADALVDAAPGDRRITVVMSDSGDTSPTTSLFMRRRDCFRATKFWLCGRDLAAVPGLTPTAGAELRMQRTDVNLAVNTPAFNAALVSGWSKPESTGVWSEGHRAVLRLPNPGVPPGEDLIVRMQALSFAPAGRPGQRARVSVAGRLLAEWRLDPGGYFGYQAAAPAELIRPGAPIELTLDLPDASSPNDTTPAAGDARVLGIGVKQISLAH